MCALVWLSLRNYGRGDSVSVMSLLKQNWGTENCTYTQTHRPNISKGVPQAAISGCHSSWALRQKDRERDRRVEKKGWRSVGVVTQWRLTRRQEADGANEAEVFNELVHCQGAEKRRSKEKWGEGESVLYMHRDTDSHLRHSHIILLILLLPKILESLSALLMSHFYWMIPPNKVILFKINIKSEVFFSLVK